MDYKAFVLDYQRLRSVSIEVSNAIIETLAGGDFKTAARHLGILQGETIVFDTEDESSVLMDYAIHDIYQDGSNATSRFLQTEPYTKGSNELCLLRSMQTSHFALLQAKEVIPGVGVLAVDLQRNTPILLIDINFSNNAEPGLMLATRIHSPGEGWWMTTGAALPVNHQAFKEIQNQLGNYSSTDEDPARNAMILRACLSAGASNQIGYAPIPAAPGHPLAVASKAGRNEPCPCGSGKKYKKCCGG